MLIPQNRQEFGTTKDLTEGLVVSERRVAGVEARHHSPCTPLEVVEGVWVFRAAGGSLRVESKVHHIRIF